MRFEKKNGDNFEIQVDNLERGFKFVPKLDLNGNLSYNDLKDKPILPEGGIKTVEGELIEVPSKLSDLENDVGFLNASNGIANNLTINGLTSNGEFEIFGTSPHIDFHYNNSTNDYTSRIIENSEGAIEILAPNGLKLNGSNLKYDDTAIKNRLTAIEKKENVTLTANTDRITNVSYTAKYFPLLGLVFVKIYGNINCSMSAGYGYTLFSIDNNYLPDSNTALSVKIGTDDNKAITKKAAAYAKKTKSGGVINIQPLDGDLKEYDVYITGFWFV